ncbi:MAG: Glycosyl transferase group 1 [Parcubacteria group bacterium GW2011_GWE2_40_8]|nr:MAG: Glycosyl transferase group 1 [Parcubacteria group bacterium GW2011_GWE2_40_8]
MKHLIKRCAGIVSITNGLKDFYVKNGVDAEKIIVASDAVDIADFSKNYIQTDVRKKFGLPVDKKIILYAGRLDGWKGVETIFKMSKFLPDEIRVVIIGGESKQISQLKEEYPHIIFLGQCPYRELAENLAAADALLLPNTGKNEISAHFTSPLKLFAYMASKKPIIASELPSLREILNEENAYLVEPDDEFALEKTVKRVLNQKEISESKANEAYQDVQKYTWRARANKIINFINKI